MRLFLLSQLRLRQQHLWPSPRQNLPNRPNIHQQRMPDLQCTKPVVVYSFLPRPPLDHLQRLHRMPPLLLNLQMVVHQMHQLHLHGLLLHLREGSGLG